MNNIEWKEGAVCYADGQQWFLNTEINKNQYQLSNENLDSSASFDWFLSQRDFQLNEPRQGYYIPKSELDIEQKCNDTVEVLGLFGFKPNSRFASYQDMYSEFAILIDDGKLYQESETYPPCKRKLTYNQLMAIGKLKRLMNERDKVNTSENPNSSELKDGDKYIRTIYGLCGTPIKVDVYRVSDAFPTGSAPIDHAVKKMLCAGLRGHKDKLTDIDNAIESLQAARLLLIQKGEA